MSSGLDKLWTEQILGTLDNQNVKNFSCTPIASHLVLDNKLTFALLSLIYYLWLMWCLDCICLLWSCYYGSREKYGEIMSFLRKWKKYVSLKFFKTFSKQEIAILHNYIFFQCTFCACWKIWLNAISYMYSNMILVKW